VKQPRAGEPPLRLAPLCMGDSAALARLHAALFPPGWGEDAFRSFMADQRAFGFRIRQDRLAGFILCRVVADEAEILTLAVAPAQRGRGAGRALVALAMAEAARLGARQMFLEVREDNAIAQALYQSLGFIGVGRREAYYRGDRGIGAGGAALVLRCELCDPKSQAAYGVHSQADERSR